MRLITDSLGSRSSFMRKKMEIGLQRRDRIFTKQVFSKYCGSDAKLQRSYLPNILAELGKPLCMKEIDDLFFEFDTNDDEGLDWEEFSLLLSKSGRIEEWAKSLNLEKLLADLIPVVVGKDALRVVADLTEQDQEMICNIYKEGLMCILKDSSSKLNEAFRISDSRTTTDDSSKFNIVPVSCGCIDDFHAGIESRTG
jgi:hypothetical protein